MLDYKEVRRLLNKSGMSIKKLQNGNVAVRDSQHFRGASMSALTELQDYIAGENKDSLLQYCSELGIRQLDTVASCNARAVRMFDGFQRQLSSGESFTAADIQRSIAISKNLDGGILNPAFNLGNYSDFSTKNVAFPNIFISPREANALYSQKGIFETVIDKKSKSILLNGCRITNPKLSVEQIDTVNERMEMRNLRNIISDSVRDSLVYGGSIVFPMLKGDTPLTVSLDLNSLFKLGLLRKDCIDYFVHLDRWNCFIIPPYNPTQRDFYSPSHYTVAFLGSDVNANRVARVVTSEQAGYWGAVLNQGWGISDFCGYLQSGMNYKVAMQSIPLMIQQMSILVRSVNVDGVLATEGTNVLDALTQADTIRLREVSANNPISMDVLGNIQSIDRRFDHVPELLRLIRQDFSSDAKIPEPLMFSSDKGNFSSGDDTEGNMNKQWESIKMLHKGVEPQFQQVAKLLVIDALGTDRAVLEALPYTKIHFDEPVIANALDKAQIGKFYSENVFNLVASKIPIDIAVEMASKNVSTDMAVSHETLEKLQEIQKRSDEMEEIRFNMEMEQQKAAIEAQKQNVVASKAATGTAGSSSNSNKASAHTAEGYGQLARRPDSEKSYSKLEQKAHETTRGSSKREEKQAKQQNYQGVKS